MAFSEVTAWPAGVMKILHFICNAVVFIILMIYYSKTSAAHYLIWTILFGILLVCSIILLILLIFKDGSNYKEALFAYYVVGCAFAFVGMIAGGIFLGSINWSSIAFIIAEVCTMLVFIFYAVSAWLNSSKGSP